MHFSDMITDDGMFTGYAAIFDTEDIEGDVLVKGAFANSLHHRLPDRVQMLYQHDATQPIGKWLTVAEDNRGLFVQGQLLLDLERAQEVYHLIRSDVLTGLSIGYRTVKSATIGSGPARALYEVDLWEVSLVTFPMHPEAQIIPRTAIQASRNHPPTDMNHAIKALEHDLRAQLLL